MNGRPNRGDTDRADLVAHVAERIRTHPGPLLRARAVQIIGVKEGMQAIDRWMDPRGAVIAHNELRRRVDELAASAELADLEQDFRRSGQHPARHGGDIAFYGFFGLSGPAAYLLSADDPDLAAVKRDITLCLDRIHTISVSWADIAGLPALDQRLIPQLPSGITPSSPGHHFDEKVTQ